MKKFIAILLILAVAVPFFSACSIKKNEVTEYDPDETYYADIIIKDYGTITVKLDSKSAPITVKNFVNLALDGFYDGLTFHRIMKGFMMQGGDPEGNGTGGSGQNIKGEFAANGVNNTISHKRGVISMARGGYSYDSASSQFFIMHMNAPHLDSQYAAFGKLTSGIEVVDKIANLKTDYYDCPREVPVIEKIEIL